MEDELREKAGDARTTRLVCRTGDPMEIADHDAEVIEIVLAIRNRPDGPAAAHIAAPLKDSRNASIVAQTCRQSGLSVV